MSEPEIQTELLPLGSIVQAEGTDRKLMIIGRTLAVSPNGKSPELYDYAAVVYPYGLMGDAVVYFNHESITNVVFLGFVDDEDVVMQQTIAVILESISIPRAQPGIVAPSNQQSDTW